MKCFLDNMDYFLELLVKCSITIPVTLLILPIYLFMVVIAFIYRTLVVRVLARYFGDQDLGEPLDLGSAFFGQIHPLFTASPGLVILPTVVLEGVPDVEKIREMGRQKLFGKKDDKGNPFYPELLQTLEYFMGYPFWKRIPGLTEELAIHKYVTFHEKMGGWDPNSLLEFTKEFATKQFKRGEPLWEVAVLPDYRSSSGSGKPQFALVPRAHHILTDGVGFMSVLENLGENGSQTLDKIRALIPSSFYVYKFLSPIYRGVYDLVTFVINTFVVASANSLWPVPSAVEDTCSKTRKGFSAAQSLSLGSRCATLTTVKEISQAWRVSGTTVILTAILRSVRKALFDEKAILPSFVGMVMPLASPAHSGKLTNEVFYINPILPLYVENPEHHATEVDKAFRSLMMSSLPYVSEIFFKFGGLFPHFMMESLYSKIFSARPENLIFSTIIGPKESSTICGYRSKDMSCFIQSMEGQKLPVFQLLSATDKLYLALTADKCLINDDAFAEKMVLGFHDEIASFQDALTASH